MIPRLPRPTPNDDPVRACTRQEAYRADITYGTNNEYGFDYLRDNLDCISRTRFGAEHFLLHRRRGRLYPYRRGPCAADYLWSRLPTPKLDYEKFARIAEKLIEGHRLHRG